MIALRKGAHEGEGSEEMNAGRGTRRRSEEAWRGEKRENEKSGEAKMEEAVMMKVMMMMMIMIMIRKGLLHWDCRRAALTPRTRAEEHRVVGWGARRSVGERRLKSTARSAGARGARSANAG